MLRIAPILFAIAGSSALAACGDDPVKPGAALVKWNTGPTGATCGTFQVTNLEARLVNSKGEEIASGSSQCPSEATNGSISIPEVKPGSYKVELEGYNAAGRGTYYGEIAKQNIGEGKTAETTPIVLALKPGTITVDWTVPGSRCASAGITDLEFLLYKDASVAPQQVGTTTKVKCDSDPFDITGLTPNGDMKVVAFAYNSAKKKVATGSSEFFPLAAGDELDKTIAFETCPGDPPACP